MNKLFSIINCISIFILSCVSSVAFAQTSFTVTGTGKTLVNGDKIYLVCKFDDKQTVDSTTVNNNMFKFTGMVNGIRAGYLTQNENPLTVDIIHQAVVYIEQGNISVISVGPFIESVVSGTTTNEDYAQLTAALMPLLQQKLTISNDYDALPAEQQKYINITAAFRENIRLINNKMEPIQFDFVQTHPASYISLATLNLLKRNVGLLRQVEEAYSKLSPAVKETALGISLGKGIEAALKAEFGVMATDFVQPDTQGKLVKLSDFRNKYVLVDFWASWCAPCRAENPFILAAYNKFKNNGFTVLSISLDDQDTGKAWLKAIKDDGLPWTQVSDLKGFKNAVAKLYGIQTIPANILVDPSGKIVARNIQDKTLYKTLETLLGAAK